MCNLCNPELKEQEQKRMRAIASSLRELAQNYEAMASFLIPMHNEKTKIVSARAKSVIRELVEDWV